MKLQKLIILFICLLHSPSLWARWAAPSEASTRTLLRDAKIDVAADGTSRWAVEIHTRADTDSGRQDAGSFQFFYTPSRERFKILEAHTITNGKTIPVEQEFIEDKLVPSSSRFSGFDDRRQVTVVYPTINIGSVTVIKYVYEVYRPIVPGWFTANFWGSNQAVEKDRAEIRSPKPLKIFVRDNDKVFRIATTHEGGKSVIRIENKRPYYYLVKEETDARRIESLAPIVMLSSFSSWKPVVDYFSNFLDEQRREPIPEKLASIVAEARTKTTEKEKIDTVMKGVITSIRYVGDWRTYEGSFFPRTLETIEKTGFGDCKDFSYTVVRLLQELGLKANWALVYRNVDSDELSLYQIPFFWFNHAFVYVQGAEREYWLEPTDSVSFAQSIPLDSENRPALVMRKGNTYLSRTPKYTANDSFFRFFAQLAKTKSSGEVEYNGLLTMNGRAAVSPTRLASSTNPTEWRYEFMKRYVAGDMNNVVSWSTADMPSFDVIVKDFSFGFKYTERDAMIAGSMGPAYLLRIPYWTKRLFTDPRNRVADLVIGPAGTEEQVWELPEQEISGSPPKECEISNRWVSVKRGVEKTNGKIRIVDSVKIHEDILPLRALQSPEYQNDVKKIKACFRDYAFIWP